jgi:hypothetical protein
LHDFHFNTQLLLRSAALDTDNFTYKSDNSN